MYKWLVAGLVVAVMAGCGNNTQTAKVNAAPAKPKHNYVVKEGMKYGYPAAISEDGKKAGQVAEKLVMAMYAGEKNGKHQMHIVDGTTVTAIECEMPCTYIKSMTFIDNPYLRNTINTQHFAANPNSLAYYMMQDAMSGELRQYGREFNGKRYTMWVDEKKGMQRTKMADSI